MSDDLLDQWHRAAANELEARVKNRLFFLTIGIDPSQAQGGSTSSPTDVAPETWDTVADGVEQWLEGIDPDVADADDPPSYEARPAETSIELTATPKKPKRRGTDPLVVNPYPSVSAFGGSYTTGPPPEFDDGT